MINFKDLFGMLSETSAFHCHQSPLYKFTNEVCADYIASSAFARTEPEGCDFGPFGTLVLPYYSMGNIDSLKLFGLDELILFAFYLRHKESYKNVADMGANIGLHSTLMSKIGWQVTAFEPDPIHVEKIQQHMALNQVTSLSVKENAVGAENAELVFTRLMGNRTGSHIKGKKQDVYGDTEEFTVSCLAFAPLMTEFDFIKMDIEGAEADAICATGAEDWQHTDVMLEVGSDDNAKRIFEHAQSIGLSMFSQKTGWEKVASLKDMPVSHREGSLFLSANKTTVW